MPRLYNLANRPARLHDATAVCCAWASGNSRWRFHAWYRIRRRSRPARRYFDTNGMNILGVSCGRVTSAASVPQSNGSLAEAAYSPVTQT